MVQIVIRGVNFDHQIEVSGFLVMSILSRHIIFGMRMEVSILMPTADKRQENSEYFLSQQMNCLNWPPVFCFVLFCFFFFHTSSMRGII